MEQNHNRTDLFENARVSTAVWTLAVPTIITQLINIIYNFADTWFVGRTGNADMVAAMSICMPIFVIMAALANLFGIGGASVISRCLGMRREDRARHVFAFCLYGGLVVAILYSIVIALFRSPIIWLIGGTEGAYAYAYDYIYWTMILGSIPTVGNVLCGHLVRSLGAAREAGIGMSLGGILNCFLDPLFMFVLLPAGCEVTGAAIATLLSNTCALLYFVILFIRRRSHPVLTVDPRDISLADHIPADVLFIGIPAAIQTTLAMVSNIFANALVTEFGSAAVAGMGVAKKVNMIAFNTTMGLTQGVLPLLGYCYGAGNYSRLKAVFAYTAKAAFLFSAACTILFKICREPFVSFFINNADSVAYGAMFLNVIAYAAPLCAVSYLTNTMFQAAGRRNSSFLLCIMRKGLVDIPAMFAFKSLLGIIGVVWATPFAEVVSAVVAFCLLRRFLHGLPAEDAPAK